MSCCAGNCVPAGVSAGVDTSEVSNGFSVRVTKIKGFGLTFLFLIYFQLNEMTILSKGCKPYVIQCQGFPVMNTFLTSVVIKEKLTNSLFQDYF